MTDMNALLDRIDALDELPDMTALRERTHDLLDPQPGEVMVDVGCGGGRAVSELSRRGVRAVGVDPSEVMLAAARQRWPRLEFHRATAEELPFDDATVDGYRADKVFHAVDDPRRAIREAHRVLRPGGRVVLAGQDWDLIAVDADDPDLTRKALRVRAATLPSPNIARGYRNLLCDNGFTDVTVEVHTVIPPREIALRTLTETLPDLPGAATWAAEQRSRAAADRLFLAIPMFVAAGRR